MADPNLAQWQNKMRDPGVGAGASSANAAKEAEERKKKEAYVRCTPTSNAALTEKPVRTAPWKSNGA